MTAPATWSTAYMVALFKAEAGLQDANEYDDELDLCPRLSRAQVEVIELLAQRYPKALYQAPILMVPSADRKTFSFGTDEQDTPIMPLGYVQIARNLNAFTGDHLFSGLREDLDFLDEGTQIRIPGNRSFAGTLYARFVPTPPDLSITRGVDPILNPAPQRRMIVNRAVKSWALEGNQRPDIAQVKDAEWKDMFPSACLTYKKRYRNGGALIDSARWYLSVPDLGATGS